MPSHAHAVARTTRNVIILNSDYLQRYRGDVKEEFSGIVYHESARVWQNNGNGQAPAGLLSGIADYVRMKAGHSSKDWPRKGSGSQWDQGYAVTAYFLEYCSSLRPGGNFVHELNAMMKHSYTHEYFHRLLGRSIHELWSNYLNYYRQDVGEVKPTLRRPSSPQKTQFGTREGTINRAVVQPRLSEETYELVSWYQQRSVAASRDQGEATWDCLAKKIRGLIRMTTLNVAAYHQNKEDGYGYA
ncbi:hypothetical protein MLD38_004918 [Melastoma candidum]|nr:hypothetical protein MLD38_004918 [Melastoma candidum]